MSDNYDLDRRTFLKASGLTAAGLAVGAGTTAAAEGADGFDPAFANWRVREASKVWAMGYTGRQDRPLGLTDSGVDALHPDLGPWNGVRVESVGDTFQLVEDTYEELPDANYDTTLTLGAGLAGSSTVSTDAISVPAAADRLRLGAFDAGLEENVVVRVLDSGGNELASNDGLLGDYIGLATPVSRGQTNTVTVEIEATDSTGADVDLRVRFFENTAGRSGDSTETVTTFEQVGTQTIEDSIGPTLTGAPNSTNTHPVDANSDADRVSATLTFSPQPQDLDFALVDGEGNEVASSGNLAGESESFTVGVGPDYEFVVKGYAAVQADYTIEATYEEQIETTTDSGATGPNTTQTVIDGIDAVTDPDDKTLAWYGTPRYGQFAKPRDGNGHGSHCSSIMGGSGRASTVDTDSVQVEEPRAVLLPEQPPKEYTVDAPAGTGVFATAYGTALSVRIEGPAGETLAHSHLLGGGPHTYDASLLDSNIATAPTVHESGEATYTVYVSPSREGETGASLAAELDRIAVGSYLDPGDTAGEADSAPDDGVVDTINAGVAPDAGIVGVQGLGDGLAAFARDPAFWTREFGVRTVNMSWGTVGGAPFGGLGGVLDGGPAQVKQMAEGGLLTVAAAGNSFTPANGNSAPAVADEAISVVATGPLDGISAFSSGGVEAVDEDDDGTYGKPDVTAPGGRAPLYPASVAVPVYDDILAAEAGIPEEGGERRAYTGKGGTSMASPFTNGVAGLVAEAMDAEYGDAPASIALPDPTETSYEDVMRLKQVLLATASETAFTAAPYHAAKSVPHAPTYDFGDRDPYEGFGRVNPDAAVQALTRELTGTTSGAVGLNLPEDSRAIAGYVQGSGTFAVDLSVSHLSGGNKGMAKGSPHLDLFVYDAESPAAHGEPNVVARSQALQGSTSVSFAGDGTYFVVAKLVNVPGVVNGYDVQAHVDLSVAFDAAPPVESATRTDNASVYTGGQTARQQLDLTASEPVYVRDTVPAGWSVEGGDYDHTDTAGDVTRVVFTDPDGDGTTSLDADYFAEAPSGAENSGQSTFGPIEVSVDGETWVAVEGTTDTNTVVGQST